MTEGRKSKRIKLSPSELEERNNILLRLQENGEMDRLKKRFLARLILQESWKEEMKDGTCLAVKRSGGISQLTMDVLIHQLMPTAKQLIPPSIEADMKKEVKEACNVK